MSQLSTCLAAAPALLVCQDDAEAIITQQIKVIRGRFQSVCDEAELATVDRQLLWRQQFLNPFAFYGVPEGLGAADRIDYRVEVEAAARSRLYEVLVYLAQPPDAGSAS